MFLGSEHARRVHYRGGDRGRPERGRRKEEGRARRTEESTDSYRKGGRFQPSKHVPSACWSLLLWPPGLWAALGVFCLGSWASPLTRKRPASQEQRLPEFLSVSGTALPHPPGTAECAQLFRHRSGGHLLHKPCQGVSSPVTPGLPHPLHFTLRSEHEECQRRQTQPPSIPPAECEAMKSGTFRLVGPGQARIWFPVTCQPCSVCPGQPHRSQRKGTAALPDPCPASPDTSGQRWERMCLTRNNADSPEGRQRSAKGRAERKGEDPCGARGARPARLGVRGAGAG